MLAYWQGGNGKLKSNFYNRIPDTDEAVRPHNLLDDADTQWLY